MDACNEPDVQAMEAELRILEAQKNSNNDSSASP